MNTLRLLLASFFIAAVTVGAEDPSDKIDLLLEAKLAEKEKSPLPAASDEVFVRRVHLDLIGRIPTKSETMAFLESSDPEKRKKLVDSLIGTDGYVSHWYNYWADLLRAKTAIAGNANSADAGMAYEQWIKEAIRSNKPYDEMVYELVTATGSAWKNPAVGYYIRDFGMPLDNLAITTQVFLGTQIVCAQCHNHPFDQWTQMDYYHLAAFTYPQMTTNNHPNQKRAMEMLKRNKGKVSEKEARDLSKAFSEILFPLRFNNVAQRPRDLRLPHDYQYDDAKPNGKVEPATLLGKEAVISPSKPLVQSFGEWLTSSENPRFTTVIANRLWKEAFGVGLIEPIDDLKENTISSNPELMAFLETLLIDLDYDLQAFQKIIYSTAAYGRESSTEEPVPGAPYDFAGPILRRMSSEQIWDSLVALTVENPDSPDAARQLAAEERRLASELVAEAVYDQTPAQFLKDGRAIAKVQKQLAIQIEEAEAKVQEAREIDDPDLIKAALAEVRIIRDELYASVEELVYREGLQEKISLTAASRSEEEVGPASPESLEYAALLSEAMTAIQSNDARTTPSERAVGMGKKKKTKGYGRTGTVIEPLVREILSDRRAEIVEQRKAEQVRQKAEWKVVGKEEVHRYRNFLKASSRMQRASEIDSPAPPGHFLREFGQSDRELVENASDQASVTQALAMLNGPTLSAVSNRYSVLSREMRGENFRDRLDTIYLSMLSRLPTPAERQIFRKAWDEDPGTGTVQGILWTVLNTRQFLFIQ